MATVLTQALDLVASSDEAASAVMVGRAFHTALEPYGLRASYSRAYGAPVRTSELVYARVSPPGWEEAYAREKLGTGNFLVRESRWRSTPFAWSTLPRVEPNDSKFWAVLHDYGFTDGLGVPCHGPNGYLGVVSLAFESLPGLAPDERRAIEVASLIVHDRMRALATVPERLAESLSARERDCLGFVAEGKSDWEIGVILSISQTTAHTHVENAKRKLGARTRAQACARAVALGLV